MANPEHFEIVKRGASAIESWRRENPHTILDLDMAKLSGAKLAGADLSFSNLSMASLIDADLRDATLDNSDMSCTFLDGADFRGACLSSALLIASFMNETDFREADLSVTNLSGSQMKEANLSKADLSGANLTDVDLSQANLSEAISQATAWGGVDLSNVIGIETIEHKGPSSIGINTLVNSRGMVPEIFLRGCGVSDDIISYIPSLFANSAIDFYSCFISYSHEDKTFARRLHDALQGRGIRCWLDEHQILPGDNIYDRIDHGIRVWDKVLLCASKHSLTSGWVDDELKHAFAKEKQLFQDRGCEVQSLIPLNLDGYLFSDWNHSKKNQVLERMAPDFTGWESDNAKFEQQFERVVKALQTNNTGREPEPKPKL